MTVRLLFTFVSLVLLNLLLFLSAEGMESTTEYQESGIPLYTVYNLEELEVGLSNLQLMSDSLGRLIIYEDGNLYRFNGHDWEGDTVVEDSSALFVTIERGGDGELYAGGVGTWGKLVMQPDGKYLFENLSKGIEKGWASTNRFHLVVAEDNGAVFVGETAVVRYDATDGNTTWKWLNSPSDVFRMAEKTYIATQNEGVFSVESLDLVQDPLLGSFKGDRAIFNHVNFGDNSLILSTRSAGFFRFDGEKVTPIETEIDGLLENSVSDLEVIDGQYLAVSLKGYGIYFLDEDFNVLTSIEKEVDATFVSANDLYYSEGGVIWVSVPDGIAKIHFPNPITLIDERMGAFLEWPKLQSFGEKLYISSLGSFYEGVYNESNRLKRYEPVQIPGDPIMRAAAMTPAGIVYGEEDEVYFYNPSTKERRLLVRGVTANLVRPIRNRQDLLVVLGADFHQLLKFENGTWKAVGARQQSSGYSCVCLEGDDGAIWVEHGINRFARITLKNGDEGLEVTAYDSAGVLPEGWVNIWQYDGAVYLSSQGSIVRYDEARDAFEPSVFPEWLDPSWAHEIVRPQVAADGSVWVTSGGKLFIVRKGADGEWYRDDETLSIIKDANQELLLDDSGAAYIYSKNRVYCYNPDVSVAEGLSKAPVIEKIMTFSKNEILYSGSFPAEIGKLILPYKDNDLEFSFFSPGSFENTRIRFSYRLVGLTSDWSEPGRDTHVVFNNLLEGSYLFAVRSLDAAGNVMGETEVFFRIKPPFVRSIPAVLMYSLLFVGLIFLVIHWALRKSEAKRVELESLVTDRTSMLDKANQQLQLAVDRAEKASSAKGRFLANMSHEIRTPMNGVLGMAEILKQTDLSNEQQEIVNTIDDSGHLLLSVINDILDYSRLETDEIRLEYIPYHPGKLCERVMNLLYPAARDKDNELWLDLDPSIPSRVVGDSTRVEQILVNLVNNANKFTESGEVRIRLFVDAKNSDEHRDMLVFEVRDDGIGIAPEKQQFLFKPFSQVDPSNTRIYGGSGLGLAICKKLTDEMKGSIAVESEPGKGSCFRVCLPFEKGELMDDGDNGAQHVGFKTVAIVDNHPARAASLSLFLKAAGLQCFEFQSVEFLLDQDENDSGIRCIVFTEQPTSDSLRMLESKWETVPPVVVFKEPGAVVSDPLVGVSINKPVKPTSLLEILQPVFEEIESSGDQVSEGIQKEFWQSDRQRILVVEDNQVNQKVAKLMLEKLGMHCDIVSNGMDALTKFEENVYQLVLMDIQMPGIDGMETTRRIRKLNNVHQPNIHAMSAGTMKEEQELALKAGMDGFISKPLELSAMKQVLQKVFGTGSK